MGVECQGRATFSFFACGVLVWSLLVGKKRAATPTHVSLTPQVLAAERATSIRSSESMSMPPAALWIVERRQVQG